jgi:hypothetical protein
VEVTLFLAGAAALLALPIYLSRYWHHLPEAPSCPHCRKLTHRPHDETLGHRLVEALPVPVTSVRTCSVCGWQGRMRWRWAPRGVRRE